MEDRQNIIGLSELLDEVNRDLDDFRKKHASDYSVKNITLWWELERERLLARHNPECLVRRFRRIQKLRHVVLQLLAGWVTLVALVAIMELLVR